MGFDLPTALPGTIGADRQAARAKSAGQIGGPLEDVRSRLMRLAVQLRDYLDEHAQPLLVESQRLLESRTCRISVIGQIKAGKSTFINALAQKPGLLPTDINPWTAVVTLLSFGQPPSPEGHAATFRLFSTEEWKSLAEGGGRLRELTERLVPEFQPELLRAQLEVMRKRAERRLGPEFHQLLGQVHRYTEITPDLLSDYISAGDDYSEGGSGSRHQYSDITRTAELTLPDGPFAFPVTLIDTPGTNDPFLVRDEITRRSLEDTEIYLFVISARQPLSATDISMLRLLNGLHKDRIVVFINRTDQLADPVADAAAIKASVEERLRLEFPKLQIPVVTGSAWWANLSLESEKTDFARTLKPSAVAALREFGLPASIDVNATDLSSVERSRIAVALHTGSGLPAVAATVTRLMSNGASALLLRQITTCFLELVRSAEISSEMELRSIRQILEAKRTKAETVGIKIKQEADSLALFEQRARQLRESFQQIEAQLGSMIAQSMGRVREDLRRIVTQFSDEAARLMVVALNRRQHGRSWVCDAMPLRHRLEEAYVASFREVYAELQHIERILYPQLKAIIDSQLPGYGSRFIVETSGQGEPYPSVARLTDTVVLDLGISWWRQWFAAKPDVHERALDLKRLIRADFFPVVDELVADAEAQLGKRVGRTLVQASAVGDTLIDTIAKRRAELVREQDSVLGIPGEGATLEDFERTQLARAQYCVKRKETCAGFVVELERLLNVLQPADAEEKRPS
jgi:signal recognition particle receptor subunit beta